MYAREMDARDFFGSWSVRVALAVVLLAVVVSMVVWEAKALLFDASPSSFGDLRTTAGKPRSLSPPLGGAPLGQWPDPWVLITSVPSVDFLGNIHRPRMRAG